MSSKELNIQETMYVIRVINFDIISYLEHILVHIGENPYQYELCDLFFFNQKVFQTTKGLTYTDDKPYQTL